MFESVQLVLDFDPAAVPERWDLGEMAADIENGFDDDFEGDDVTVTVLPDEVNGRLLCHLYFDDPPPEVLPGFINRLIVRWLTNKLEREARRIGEDAPFDIRTKVTVK